MQGVHTDTLGYRWSHVVSLNWYSTVQGNILSNFPVHDEIARYVVVVFRLSIAISMPSFEVCINEIQWWTPTNCSNGNTGKTIIIV